jgi:hypothetical protein
MTNVLFLHPRLDCTFKEGPCPLERDLSIPLPPIRQHWENFKNKIVGLHEKAGDNVKIIEAPNWTFTPDLVNTLKPDICYIPHKQNYQFPIDKGILPRYTMQTVFPWLFTVNVDGWGADSSDYKSWFAWATGASDSGVFEKLQERAKNNESKFRQPAKQNINFSDYVLFVCQIPHDEVIKYHSQVTVAEALKFTLEFCRETGRHCVVKGHPVNPGSMIVLQNIQKQFTDVSTWTDNYSIHSLLENAESVFLVNSGVGYEALLHEKPVYCYGRVEYDCVVNKVNNWDMNKLVSTYTTDVNVNAYKKFIDKYVSLCIDSTP